MGKWAWRWGRSEWEAWEGSSDVHTLPSVKHLGSPMDRGAWATVHGAPQRQTRLKWPHTRMCKTATDPGAPALQVDSLPAEPSGKPHEIGS